VSAPLGRDPTPTPPRPSRNSNTPSPDPAKLQRPLLDYSKQNFWIAGSGTVSERYLRWTAEIVGTDRMVYSTDYPYTFGTRPGGFPFLDTSNGVARSFLDNAPFTYEEKVAIGSGNWERLTAR
jgi:predicted TIM-barrel fold metal-dependent hydrolase